MRLFQVSLKRISPVLKGVVALTALLALAFPVVNGVLVYPAFEEILIEGVERDASLITRHISPLLISEQAEHGYATLGLRELQAIEGLERDLKLVKLRFINERGVILYSSEGSEFGGSYPQARLDRLAQSGQPISEFTTIHCLYPENPDCVADVVVTTVPLVVNGAFIGALESSINVTNRKEKMDSIVFWSLSAMAVLAVFLVSAVLGLLIRQAQHVQLLESNQELRSDVERIAHHDLRSPLTNILSGTNYLLTVAENRESREILDQMQTSGWRMMRMINRSLDLYKMECGTYQFVPEAVNVLAVMRNVALELEDLATSRDVSVHLSHEGRPYRTDASHVVPVEEMLTHTLVANLLKNALEAVERGGEVFMDLRFVAGMHVLSVRNAGNVPEEIRPTFFDKYVTHGKKSGTGLGTYSARLITETQQGTIDLLCDGTTVTIEVRFPDDPDLTQITV